MNFFPNLFISIAKAANEQQQEQEKILEPGDDQMAPTDEPDDCSETEQPPQPNQDGNNSQPES